MKKTFWFINLILCISYLILRIYIDPNISTEQVDIVAEIFSLIFPIIIIGSIIGLILAIIPFKSRTYLKKLKLMIPVGFFLAILIALINLFIYSEKNMEFNFVKNIQYDQINIPSKLDCSTIKNGDFETEELIIKRIGNRQFQTNKKTGLKEEYYIKWKFNCEYILTSVKDSTSNIKVKVVGIKKDSYNCYYTSKKYANPLKVYRIKNSS